MGHSLPQLGLLRRIVQNRPDVVITLFVYAPHVNSTRREVEHLLPESYGVRLVGVGPYNGDTDRGFMAMAEAFTVLQEIIPEAYKELVSRKRLTCSVTETLFDYSDIPLPTVVLSDMVTPFAGQAIQAISPEVKLIVSWMSTSAYFVQRFGPDALGGFGSLEERARAVLQGDVETEKIMEVAASIEADFKGHPLVNPENLEMFDYEIYPQDVDNGSFLSTYVKAARQTNKWADGAAICSTRNFEPRAHEALRNWYEQQAGKKVFFVGPYTSPVSIPKVPRINAKTNKVISFLDSQPRQAVWLVSFGTLFYPFRHPNFVDTVLRTLLRANNPFIMSRAASTYTPISEEIVSEATERGLGLFDDFVPQSAVLAHPSTGAFISHGGVNSMFESIEANVLAIFWPITGDQHLNAAHMTLKHDCSFELIQVRTGTGAQPPKRGGVVHGTDEAVASEVEHIISDLKGPVGDRKRRNLAAVRAQLLQYLSKGDDADLEVQRLLDFGAPQR